MKSQYKDYLLLCLVFLSQAHIVFRGVKIKVDWFLFTDVKRGLSFSVFLLCLYLRIIILHYCLLNPKGINRQILIFLYTLSIFDLIHFFLFSSIGYEVEKLIIVFVFLYVKERFFKW